MPRRLRIEFENAIDHVMARGNARQVTVRDDDDRQRLLHDLERTVERSGWQWLASVVMNYRLHRLVKTPTLDHVVDPSSRPAPGTAPEKPTPFFIFRFRSEPHRCLLK